MEKLISVLKFVCEGEVWVVAECNKHGRWASNKKVTVAAGGC